MNDGEMEATRGPEDDEPPNPSPWVACPSCDGSGLRRDPPGDRPCVVCVGSGMVSADAAAALSKPLMRESTDEELSGPMD